MTKLSTVLIALIASLAAAGCTVTPYEEGTDGKVYSYPGGSAQVNVADPSPEQLGLRNGQIYPCDPSTGRPKARSRVTCTWHVHKAAPPAPLANPNAAAKQPQPQAKVVSRSHPWHSYAWRYETRDKSQVAAAFEGRGKFFRAPTDKVIAQIGRRLNKTWKDRDQFMTWLASDEVGIEACTPQVLADHDMSRTRTVSGKREYDFTYHRPWCLDTKMSEVKEYFLYVTINGRKEYFLSTACTNIMVSNKLPPSRRLELTPMS